MGLTPTNVREIDVLAGLYLFLTALHSRVEPATRISPAARVTRSVTQVILDGPLPGLFLTLAAVFIGGPCRERTDDQLLKSPAVLSINPGFSHRSW